MVSAVIFRKAVIGEELSKRRLGAQHPIPHVYHAEFKK